MIKNDRQYRITKSRAEEFEQALKIPAAHGADPVLHDIECAATRSQLATLREELAEYEALLTGKPKALVIRSIEEFPRVLISARIAARMSHRELAEKLGLKEQQIQRYEATDYASANLTTVGRVAEALGVRFQDDVILPKADLSFRGLWRRLKELGLPKDLVVGRMLPTWLSAQVEETSPEREEDLAVSVAGVVGRIFGINPSKLFDDSPLQFAGTAGALARFKVSASAEATRLGAYTVYAHHLALVALDAVPARPTRTMPETHASFRRAVREAYGSNSFLDTLKFAWDCNIVILPLNDPGAFHGACWRIDGRHVIVLKQKNQTVARWHFDLLHEMRHTLQEEKDPEFSVIEAEETSQERRESKYEKDADHFAANVMLDGKAAELAKRCVELAAGSVEHLKTVVPKVAAGAAVEVSALANYMAFRLAHQGTANWWGAAANLQSPEPNPWELARDAFLERAELSRVNPVDRDLLLRALSSVVEENPS